MDYDKLIKRMKCPQIHSCPMDGEYPSCKVCQKSIQQEAVTAIETLQVENQALRNAANGFKADLARVTAERDAAVENVKHLKAVMRDEGIVVIPPKYPWERSEWNM